MAQKEAAGVEFFAAKVPWLVGLHKLPGQRLVSQHKSYHEFIQQDTHRIIRRRAKAAGIETRIGNHTLRATGITAYLKNSETAILPLSA